MQLISKLKSFFQIPVSQEAVHNLYLRDLAEKPLDELPLKEQPRLDINKLYQEPGFWVGVAGSRKTGRSLAQNVVSEGEQRLAQAMSYRGLVPHVATPIPERTAFVFDAEHERMNEEMIKAADTCMKSKGDVTQSKAFLRWHGRGVQVEEEAPQAPDTETPPTNQSEV